MGDVIRNNQSNECSHVTQNSRAKLIVGKIKAQKKVTSTIAFLYKIVNLEFILHRKFL